MHKFESNASSFSFSTCFAKATEKYPKAFSNSILKVHFSKATRKCSVTLFNKKFNPGKLKYFEPSYDIVTRSQHGSVIGIFHIILLNLFYLTS